MRNAARGVVPAAARSVRSRLVRAPILGVVAALASVVFGGEARAAVPGSAYAACMAKADSTRDMQVCQTTGLAEAESRLRGAYARALAALAPDQQAQLHEAQQQWRAFRRSDCRTFHGKTAGTSASIAAGACMIDRTEQRIRELRGFIPTK